MGFDPRGALRTLVAHDVRFVVGGTAAARLQGNPTVTHDLDITPQRDLDDPIVPRARGNAQRLADALNGLTVTGPAGTVEHLDEHDLLGWRNTTYLTAAGRVDVVPDVVGVGSYEDLLRSGSGSRTSRWRSPTCARSSRRRRRSTAPRTASSFPPWRRPRGCSTNRTSPEPARRRGGQERRWCSIVAIVVALSRCWTARMPNATAASTFSARSSTNTTSAAAVSSRSHASA